MKDESVIRKQVKDLQKALRQPGFGPTQRAAYADIATLVFFGEWLFHEEESDLLDVVRKWHPRAKL